MKVQRGHVVLLPIGFTSGIGVKLRPALVVQSDHNNARLNDTIVAIITKTTHRATREPTQLLIDISSPEGQQSGLLHTSAIKCEHLVTVSVADIGRVIGSLPPATMTQIEVCLKAALARP
jgi:mRNA-degrading endonuclease toxin of MazEF toxin-antitoxin module